MLHEMLRLLSDGGVHATAGLARRLGVSEGLVAAMAADLARRGYLAALDPDCGATCDRCGLAAACGGPETGARPAPLLALTTKGRQAAGSASTAAPSEADHQYRIRADHR